MPDLLLEIGTEELPIDALDVIYADLIPRVEHILRQNRLMFESVKAEATPRRIALFIKALSARQQDHVLEITGPSAEKAFDGAGQPTPALLGFLKSKGADLGEVVVAERPKGKTVVLRRTEKGKPAAALLAGIAKEIFESMPFRKKMRWGNSGFCFPRPVRWIVFLLDRKVVKYEMGNVKAARTSYGHRFLAPGAFLLARADWGNYQVRLKRAHVWLSLEARKDAVRKALTGRFRQKNADEELIHITAQLVEEPFFLRGNFSKTYLELPPEVLATCMKKNQKIFALYGSKGKLSGDFLAVMNGKRKNPARIQADYENVLESRLRDARFFYESDTRMPLEKRRPLLEQIVYLGKLGNMLQKSERMENLAALFAGETGRPELEKNLKQVARLAKVDLMTQMVFEFPELQGMVGGEYARVAGEPGEVSRAIATQYLPKNLAEDYHNLRGDMNLLGAVFGVMDRLDLLAGAFGTGLEPTGSQDPFALRRAGGALVKLVRAFRFHFSLAGMVRASVSLYGPGLDLAADSVWERLKPFLQERTVFELQVKPGSRGHEILAAVFSSAFDDLADVFDRFDVLSGLYKTDKEEFLKTCKVVERTGNILKGSKGTIGEIKPELFTEALETELFRLAEAHAQEITSLIQGREYEKATRLFGRVFYAPLHEFFSKVMVNAEDPAIRANRQALMKRINALYTSRLADLSVLSRIDQE